METTKTLRLETICQHYRVDVDGREIGSVVYSANRWSAELAGNNDSGWGAHYKTSPLNNVMIAHHVTEAEAIKALLDHHAAVTAAGYTEIVRLANEAASVVAAEAVQS